MARLFQLSDDAWARIEPLLPHGQPGKPRIDDRRVISGIRHVPKVGCRWQDPPSAHGTHTTIHNRYNRWLIAGSDGRQSLRRAEPGGLAQEPPN